MLPGCSRNGGVPERRRLSRRPSSHSEEIQRRLHEAFAGWRPPPRPDPPVESRQPDLSPEEVQRALDEAFAGRMTPRPEPRLESREPEPALTPEELQLALDEAFGGAASRPSLSSSPRSIRALQRSLRRGSASPPPWERARRAPLDRRRRCDARVKNLFRIGKNGVRVSRGLRCRAWATESGRCRVHGGLSTGPRSPDGKARVIAAMVEGRRKWVEQQRSTGKKFPAGRTRGERWVTGPMRERARAEAHRLGGGRFTLDRALVLALLKSANGDRARKAGAKAMLDARELAAMELLDRPSGARADRQFAGVATGRPIGGQASRLRCAD